MIDLDTLVDRQINYAMRQQGERLLLVLPRVVQFMTEEPRLRAILEDIEREYEEAIESFRALDRKHAEAIAELWRAKAEWMLQAWNARAAAAGENDVWMKAGGTPSSLPEFLTGAGVFDLPRYDEPQSDPSAVGRALAAIAFWCSCVAESQLSTAAEIERNEFFETLTPLHDEHERALRAFLVVTRSHPGSSWRRLSGFARSLVLPPRLASDNPLDLLLASLGSLEQVRVANAALGLGKYDHERAKPDDYRDQIIRALEAVSEEVRHRIGLHLSNAALVNRFKTRCERFEAASLRAATSANPKKAEEILTVATAGYLFDQGLNPLFNAQIVSLRPDLFDSSGPCSLYVEAKQYQGAPRQTVVKAAWQVWDTWGELSSVHPVHEAFLLVFRRSGPLVVFDGPPPRLNGRTLHPVVVDIAEPAIRGSRARTAPVHISAAELLPP